MQSYQILATIKKDYMEALICMEGMVRESIDNGWTTYGSISVLQDKETGHYHVCQVIQHTQRKRLTAMSDVVLDKLKEKDDIVYASRPGRNPHSNWCKLCLRVPSDELSLDPVFKICAECRHSFLGSHVFSAIRCQPDTDVLEDYMGLTHTVFECYELYGKLPSTEIFQSDVNISSTKRWVSFHHRMSAIINEALAIEKSFPKKADK